MASVPFALSIHHFVNSVGADAGFAAIIGLAILVLLYFAQARETATIRERLDDSEEKAVVLEGRLVALRRAQQEAAEQGATPPPAVPGPAGARPPAARAAGVSRGLFGGPSPGAGPVLLGAPAGLAAPALNSATKLIPTPAEPVLYDGDDEEDEFEDTVFEPARLPGGVPNVTPPPVQASPVAAPSPVTATAAVAAPDARAVAAGNPAPRVQLRDPPRDGGSGRVRGGGRARGGGQTRGGRVGATGTPPGSRSLARRVLPGVAGLLVIAVAVVVLVKVTSGGTTSTATVDHSTAPRHTHHHPPAPSFSPSSVTVAVLNGTATNLLADSVAKSLANAGYKTPGTLITNAASEQYTSTIVGYTGDNREAAVHVAQSLEKVGLKVSSSTVQPASQTAIQTCESPASTDTSDTTAATMTCTAQVIVTVGSDLAGLSTSTATSA